MDTLIDHLIRVLQEEVDIFHRFLDAMEREQQALMHHNIEALELSVEAQQALSLQVAAQEQMRQRLIRQMAGLLHEDPEVLTLKRVVERIDPQLAEPLRELRETLLAQQERIRQVNRQNTLLIKQSMKYVDKSLQVLAGGHSSGTVYVQSGKVEKPTSSLKGVVNQVV